MSLLPIIYTSLLIFCCVVTTVLLVSYIVYKAKGGGPKPAALKEITPSHYPQQRAQHRSKTPRTISHSQVNSRTTGLQNDQMFYKKPIVSPYLQTPQRQASAPRVQVLNKPTDKKIVVVRKSVNKNSYDANNFLGYYNENERGVLSQI